MNRNSVKVMIYSYFLNLKSYINTYISATYTESTVSNHLPQGNHNLIAAMALYHLTVSNIIPQGNHNCQTWLIFFLWTVSNIIPQGNYNDMDYCDATSNC